MIDYDNIKDLPVDEQYKILKMDMDEISAKLSELKEQIVEKFKVDPESITMMQVVPTKAKTTTSWAKVAKEANVSQSIIQKYTKVGEPGYTLKQIVEEKTPSKYI